MDRHRRERGLLGAQLIWAALVQLQVDSQSSNAGRERGVDALVEEIHVAINFILSDRAVSVFDVLKEVTDEDVVKTFVGILD